LKILFITAHKYLPQMYGGLQSATHELCHALLHRGHDVAVLAGLMPGGYFALKSRIKMKINHKLSGCSVSKDTRLGYPVWYVWCPWDAVRHVAREQAPDLIVVLAYQTVRMALAARPTAIPLLMQLQDVEFHQHGGDFKDLGDIACVANSRFTAEKYRVAFGVNPSVIYPFVAAEKYRTSTTKENITFINPDIKKGLNIAINIARQCPEIPFSFVETWPLSHDQRHELRQNLSALPNITFLPSRADMRKVYGKCRILLAPSIWEEAYGRVVTEAQMSGIPVIGSTRGGLPEAIGPGGILLAAEAPTDVWTNAVRMLWQNNDQYAELSAAASAHAQRQELSLGYQIDAYERVMFAAANLLQSAAA
jgi:glycosyltransferase involved in cell wall biosynthesis